MGAPKQNKKYERGDLSKYVPLNNQTFQVPAECLRRMVIVDGCNMLHAPGTTGHNIRDVKLKADKLNGTALLITVYKLLQAGFEVYVTLKPFFESVGNIDNEVIIRELKRLEILRIVTEKDDDLVVLRTARAYGAVVFSNDNFSQTQYHEFKAVKEKAVRFFYQASSIPPPEHHLPENIVDLFVDLKFLGLENLFAKPTDLDFELVQKQRQQFEGSGYGQHALEQVTVLAQYMQFEHCATHPSLCQLPTFDFFSGRECPKKFEEFKREYERKKRGGRR